MKLIVLAAGIGNISLDPEQNLPKCMERYEGDETVLDAILAACRSGGIHEHCLVGGFEILKIMHQYPQLKYYYNETWQETRSLYSLRKAAAEFDADLLVSFSDIVFHNSGLDRLIKSDGDVAVAYDSLWERRFEGRTRRILQDAVKVFPDDQGRVNIGKNPGGAAPMGEFVGLVSLKHRVAKTLIPVIDAVLDRNPRAEVGDLVNELAAMHRVSAVDVKGRWAELDSPQDLIRFKFGTKADTLRQLEPRVEKSRILPQMTFTLDAFDRGPEKVLQRIEQDFSPGRVVVRSSALGEDTFTASMAGHYLSLLDIASEDRPALTGAIRSVAQSYEKEGRVPNGADQILVQPQLEAVTLSGVLFTKDLETSAPYYIVNFDEAGRTDAVTSGAGRSLRTFVHYRFSRTPPAYRRLRRVIEAVRELEALTGYDSLDVEFAMAADAVYILQVRPIAAHKDALKIYTKDIFRELNNIRAYIERRSRPAPKLAGSLTAYGIMPDWNPAEMIGINPGALAFSLYRHIISDDVWPESRKRAGYRDTRANPGIVSFCGKPYVDIRMSFNSFTPAEISEPTAGKLVDHYIDRLASHPEFHDKVEFEIVLTAYDFMAEDRFQSLRDAGFENGEIDEIRRALLRLTDDIVCQRRLSIAEEIDKTLGLAEKRLRILDSQVPAEDKIRKLLEDCKDAGTLPFAILARFAFLGARLMKSLLEKGVLSREEYDGFFQSIHTVAGDFVADLRDLSRSRIAREAFLSKYGHLRPGTYDITSPSYREDFRRYVDAAKPLEQQEPSRFSLSPRTLEKIESEIEKCGFGFSSEALMAFVRRSTEAREQAKFEFTKNLSAALDLIVGLMEELGITREESAHLEIEDILSISRGSRSLNLENELYQKIVYNREKHRIGCAIKLPELIFSPSDVDQFFLSPSLPNFITRQAVVADGLVLSAGVYDIDGKIVLIENADPGYDWIFSHRIRGIVTRYGGAASHMAIRCAEFDLPAAIGCGDVIFEDLKKHRKISLDCAGQTIRGLH